MKKSILIVEDEEVIRNLCRRILAKFGYEITFAAGFKEALDQIRASPGFDLLMTDMKLPDGDGVEVIACFRQKYPQTKVLIVTGSPTPDHGVGRLRAMGFSEDDILFKPFEIQELERAVRDRLDES